MLLNKYESFIESHFVIHSLLCPSSLSSSFTFQLSLKVAKNRSLMTPSDSLLQKAFPPFPELCGTVCPLLLHHTPSPRTQAHTLIAVPTPFLEKHHSFQELRLLPGRAERPAGWLLQSSISSLADVNSIQFNLYSP